MRVLADGQTNTQTDANRFYNLSHAICYSYGTDNKSQKAFALGSPTIWNDFRFTVDLLQLLTVLNENSDVFICHSIRRSSLSVPLSHLVRYGAL